MPESDRTKVADVVRHVTRLVNSHTRTEQDVLSVAIADTSDDTTLKLKHDTAGIRSGSYISVNNTAGTNLPETMYVYKRNDVNVSVEESSVIVELEESNLVVLRKSLYAIPLAKSNTFDCGIYYSGFGYFAFIASHAV